MTTGLDDAAIGKWFAESALGSVGPIDFARIGNGQSNLTYLATDAEGKRWVLRRPPLGSVLASAHDVLREYRILSALQNTDVPVPRMLATIEDPEFTDAPIVVMSHVDGVVLSDPALAEPLPEAVRHEIGVDMADVLGAIHAVDLAAVGLDELASHAPFAARQIRRWSAQWEKSKTRDSEVIERLAVALAEHAPEQSEVTLVHGDFHLSNVIVDPEVGVIVDPQVGRVRCVVDWELCTLGDPIADVGTLLTYWTEPGEDAIALFGASALPGFPNRAELVERYARTTGRDVSTVPYWHALTTWKLAIIAEGVLRRITDDPRNRAAGAPTKQLVDGVIARAGTLAEAAGIL